MLVALALTGWLLILGIIGFVLRDFTRFIYHKSFQKPETHSFVDLGEYATTWFVVCTITLVGFIFYKATTGLMAYVLSDDLITFFRMMRGVFTVENTEQHPFTLTHILSGLVGQSLLQLASCFLIYVAIRSFMQWVNRSYGHHSYNEGDVLYFGLFAILLFVGLEILSYSQRIPRISGLLHLLYLTLGKLSMVCYFLTIAHVRLLSVHTYRQAIPHYVRLNKWATKIIFSPYKAILFSLCIGILLNLPLFLGTQFLDSNVWVVLFAIPSCFLFYKLLKQILSRGYNYLGAIMFFDSGEMEMQEQPELLHRQKGVFLLVAGGLATVLLFYQVRALMFLLIIGLFFIILLTIVHLIAHAIGLGLTLGYRWIAQRDLPDIPLPSLTRYLMITFKGLAISILPGLLVVFGIATLFSIYPKKYTFAPDESYVNRVITSDRYPMVIGHHDRNACAPASHDEIPAFLKTCLILQEDRDFEKQKSWWPKWSNWHGVSIASVYRMLSGSGGGSNINMQLIKNEAFESSFPRDFQRKYTEMIVSYQLSMQLSPEEILTQYVNKTGMVGGIGHQGLVLAAYATFHKPIDALNNLEMMYLAASLKRSSTFKTADGYIAYRDASKHHTAIKAALLAQAERWKNEDLLSADEVAHLQLQELRLKSRNTLRDIPLATRELLNKSIPTSPGKGYTFTTTLDFNRQQKISEAVANFQNHFSKQRYLDGHSLYSAALVVEVASGKVLGHHGGDGLTDLAAFAGGSPMGSVIKPFILLELLEDPAIGPDMKLYDGKIKGKYTPNNYSRKYANEMKDINEVLSKSLNAPMVNVRELTPPIPLFKKVEERFASMQVARDEYLQLELREKNGENEINYPMGSRNMRLLDIAQVYQTLMNHGKFQPLRLFDNYYDPFLRTTIQMAKMPRQMYTPINAQTIRDALHHTMLAGGTGTHMLPLLPKDTQFFAKTGTSDGAKHGYTVLSDGKILIVCYVTYGKVTQDRLELNDTPAIPFESGVRSAGVLAAYIYRAWNKPADLNFQIAKN